MKNYLRIYFYYNNNVKMLSELIALFRGIIVGGAADLIEVWILWTENCFFFGGGLDWIPLINIFSRSIQIFAVSLQP